MSNGIGILSSGNNDLVGYVDTDENPNLFFQAVAPVINEEAYTFGAPYKEFTDPNFFEVPYRGDLVSFSPLPDNSPLLLDTKGRHEVTACVLMPADYCATAFSENAGVFALGVVGYKWDAAISKWVPDSFNLAMSDDGTSAYELRYAASDDSTKYIKTVIGGAAYHPMPIVWIPTLGYDKVQIVLMSSRIAYSSMASTYTGKILLYCRAY